MLYFQTLSYYPVPPHYPTRPLHHNPQLPQFSNFSVPQCIMKPTFSNIDNVIFPDILRLTNEKRKFISEDDMTSTLLSVLSRYGVTQFSIFKSVRNHDPITNSPFPRIRVSLICKSCSPTERKMPNSQIGCCGIFVDASLK
jgi:hypothetical protein